jgi:hypothetical protein
MNHATVLLGLFAALLILPGCPLSPDDDGGTPPDDTGIPARDTPEGTVAYYAFVWEKRLINEYEAVLHDDYEYFVRDDDADQFPWLPPGQGWSRTTELAIAANMFNPGFISDETQNAVQEIDMALTITSQRGLTSPAGAVEVTTSVDAQVLWAAGTGASTNGRFTFVLVPDPDEPQLFQIFSQKELPTF